MIAPYATHSKAELIRRFLARGGKESLLRETVSCLRAVYKAEGGGKYSTESCGKCSSCIARWTAFRDAGLKPDVPMPTVEARAAAIVAQRGMFRLSNLGLYARQIMRWVRTTWTS